MAFNIGILDELNSTPSPNLPKVKKTLAQHFIELGVEKRLADSLVRGLSDLREYTQTLKAIEAVSETLKAAKHVSAPVYDPSQPKNIKITPVQTVIPRSEHQLDDLSPEDAYEIGYQEGQADLEEEHRLHNIPGLTAANITLTSNLGYATKVYTIQTVVDSDADKYLMYLLTPPSQRRPPLNDDTPPSDDD